MKTGSRPRRGANAFVILADNSQSLQIRDDDTTRTRGDWVRDLLRQESVHVDLAPHLGHLDERQRGLGADFDNLTGFVNDPRTYGFEVRYKF